MPTLWVPPRWTLYSEKAKLKTLPKKQPGVVMHYYQFNIGDYQSHTAHLSDLEDLAYRRMLDWCYLHEKSLPLDPGEIARQIRMRTHSECIANVLREYFEQREDGWIHLRVIQEILKTGMKSEKASESAKARWGKNAKAMRTHSECNATQDTLPKTQNTKNTPIKIPEGVAEEVWEEFLKNRKAKKANVSALVINRISEEARKAGWTLENALKEIVIRNWQSFKADWVKDSKETYSPMKGIL